MKPIRISVLLAVTLLTACVPHREFADKNMLDGKPESANSQHCGHVRVLGGTDFTFQRDDGVWFPINATGGTAIPLKEGMAGTICLVVPMYGSDGHTYYIQSFKLDEAN